MPIPVICSCTAKLRVGDHLRGQQIQCPQCGSIHAISKKGVVSEGKPADATPPEEEIPDFDDVMEASEFTEAEEDRLDDTLEKGEKLLWAGKPVRFYPIMIGCMIAAGLIFTAAILITVTFLAPNFPSWIGLTGSGLMCAVALIVPLFNGWRFGRHAYAVTTRRALSWDTNPFGILRFQEYDPADLARITARPIGSKGIGSLIFATEVRRKDQAVVRIHGFRFIAEFDTVEKLIRERLVDPYTDRLYDAR